jgi:hypothetical protein
VGIETYHLMDTRVGYRQGNNNEHQDLRPVQASIAYEVVKLGYITCCIFLFSPLNAFAGSKKTLLFWQGISKR